MADETVDPGRYGFRIVHDQEKPHYFSSDEQLVVREWMKALMKATIHQSEASRQTFDLVTTLVSDASESHVTVDNFPGLVAVLDEYATAASLATEAQQQGRRTQALNASK